jgi:PGF-CTERM protein
MSDDESISQVLGLYKEFNTGYRERLQTTTAVRQLLGVVVVVLLVGLALQAGTGTVGASGGQSGTAIDSCQEINKSGSYHLNTSLTSGSATCIGINATDVVFDGYGENIENFDTAVKITATTDASNITVRNLTIRDAANEGVRTVTGSSDSTRNITVSNVTMENVNRGFYVPSSSESTPRVEFAIRNSTINATNDGVSVFKNDVGQYDIELDNNFINTTEGDNGVRFSVTENGTDVELSMLDNTIESSGSDGVSLSLVRSHATTDLVLRRNDINVTGSTHAVNLDGGSVSDLNTSIDVVATNNSLSSSYSALFLQLWGDEGSRDIEFANNTIETSDPSLGEGYDVIAKGENTSVDFTVLDNDIDSGDNQVLEMQGSDYPNQTLDARIERNHITNEISIKASGSRAPANISVVDNTVTESKSDVSLDVDLQRDNASLDVDTRGNEMNGSIFVTGGGAESDTEINATNNTVEAPGTAIDLRVEPNDAANQSIEVAVRDNTVNGTGSGQFSKVHVDASAPSSDANLTLADNSVLEPETNEGLLVNTNGKNMTVDTAIENNTVFEAPEIAGIKTTVNGQKTIANISLIDNTADAKGDPIALFPRGDDQDLDFELADNDLNVTQEGTSRHGILIGETGRNSTVAFSAINNTVNSTQQGIEFHLGLDSGDDLRDPVDIQVEDNVINASNEALKIFDEDTSDFATDRNITVSVSDNKITSGDQSSTSNDGQGVDIETVNDRGTDNVTIAGNVIDVTTQPVSLDLNGGETVQHLSVTNNDLTSATRRGVSLSVEVSSLYLDSNKTDVNVSENTISAENTGIYLTAEEETMSVNFTALDNTITTNATDKDGILAEVSADKMTVNANVSGNELDVQDNGITLETFSDKMNTTLAVRDNIVEPGANNGIVLEGGTGENQTVIWNVSNNEIDNPNTGIQLNKIKMRDGGSYNVAVEDNTVTNASTVSLGIDPETGSGAQEQSGTVTVEGNNLSSEATTVQIESGPVSGIDLSNNRFDANSWGVENLNTTAGYVNATDNYWGASDGPGSPGPLEDPVTGTLADGSGSNVTERGSGVSNVHFDPYLTSPPDLSADANFAVSIDGTNSPVTEGETLTVDATIENTGGQQGTQDVTVSIDGTERDSATVTLGSGNTKTRTLEWATQDGDAGTYSATVESDDDDAVATVEVESDSSDDSNTGDDSDDSDTGDDSDDSDTGDDSDDSDTGSSDADDSDDSDSGTDSTDDQQEDSGSDSDVDAVATVENSTATFDVDRTVREIKFDNAVSGSVELRSYEEKPAPIVENVTDVVVDNEPAQSDPSAVDVVSLVDISPTDTDAQQSSATVTFEVESTNLSDTDNAVVLHRTDVGWTEVPMSPETTGTGTVRLNSSIESFSLFAVADSGVVDDGASSDDGDDGTDGDGETDSSDTTDDGQDSDTQSDTGTEGSDGGSSESDDSSDDGGPGFGVVIALVALVLVGMFARRRP